MRILIMYMHPQTGTNKYTRADMYILVSCEVDIVVKLIHLKLCNVVKLIHLKIMQLL